MENIVNLDIRMVKVQLHIDIKKFINIKRTIPQATNCVKTFNQFDVLGDQVGHAPWLGVKMWSWKQET